MPWNGSGNFSRTNGVNTGTDVWQDDAATVQTILSDRHDTHDQDIADGLNLALTSDGQSWPPSANLDMGTWKFTDVGDATARNQYLSLGQFQDGKHIWCGTAGGTADALTLTPSPAIAGYTAGMTLRFTVASDNSGAVTVNVSGQGVRNLRDLFGNPLIAGSFKAGMTIEIIDTGTEFRFNGERKIVTTEGDLIMGGVNGDLTALALGAINTLLGSDGTKAAYFGGTSAKTAAYTVVVGDHRKLILVDATTAAVTITLPAVADAGDGFEITVEKTDSSVNIVTVDGNLTETIDAPGGNRQTVNLPSQFDRLKLVCDGTKWHTVDHRLTYESAPQTITSTGALTLAHGLGVEPNWVTATLECTLGEFGYNIGDRLAVSVLNNNSATSGNKGQAIVPDATNLNVRYGSNGSVYDIIHFTNGASSAITNSSWRAIFRAGLH